MAEELTKKKLILVEGKDEVNFISAILRNTEGLNDDDIGIEDIGGKDNFPVKFPTFLLRSGFNNI